MGVGHFMADGMVRWMQGEREAVAKLRLLRRCL